MTTKLPPEIATHWEVAPGATLEEKARNAWPMGRFLGFDLIAVWIPHQIVIAKASATVAEKMQYVPLVPKEKP